MDVQFWAVTDTGRVRDHNEDNFLVDRRMQLYVVCDGMGGHAAGEVASAVTAQTIREVVAEERHLLDALREAPDDLDHQDAIITLLQHAIQLACARVFHMAQQDANHRGMGTTCCLLLVVGEHGFIAHVGDSRVYLLRDGVVSQMTDDHSLLNEMIRQGKLRPGDDENFPHKNAVTRAVGVRESVEADVYEFEVIEGDRFLLCSDGLCGYFDSEPDVDLTRLLTGDELSSVAQRCIDYANNAGGKDNITVVLVEACDQPGDQVNHAADLLGRLPAFRYLTSEELERLAALASHESHEADTVFVGPGDPVDRLVLVLSGSMAVHQDGRKVAVLEAGEAFGHLGLISQDIPRWTACSIEPVNLLILPRSAYLKFLKGSTEVALRASWGFLEALGSRLRQMPYDLFHNPELWEGFEAEDGISDLTPPSGRIALNTGTASSPADGVSFGTSRTSAPPTSGFDAPLDLGEHTEAGDDFEESEEDLRATVQLDWHSPVGSMPSRGASDSAAPTQHGFEDVETVTIPALDASNFPPPKPPAPSGAEKPPSVQGASKSVSGAARPLGKAISGTSTVQKPRIPKDAMPKAQVLRKSGAQETARGSDKTSSEQLKARLRDSLNKKAAAEAEEARETHAQDDEIEDLT